MNRVFAQPAMQGLAAAVTLLAFTWPFLVFDRPIQVFAWFFGSWFVVIAWLFIFSRALPDGDAERLEPSIGPDSDD